MRLKKMAKSDNTDQAIQEACYEPASDKVLALLYLENSDQIKYGTLLKGLSDQYSLNQDQYLKTINHAMNVLSNHHFDLKYYEKKQKNQEKENKNKNKEGKSGKEDESDQQEDVPRDINFAQLKGMCYCCGKKVTKAQNALKKINQRRIGQLTE
jgi:hypothetical protein